MTGLPLHVDASDFGDLARATKGAEKDITKAVRKAMRDVARPLGETIVRSGSESMPARGGLRDRLMRRRVGITFSLGREPRVTMSLGSRKDPGLKPIDEAGTLRHPVFKRSDRKSPWVAQRVPAGTYRRAFEAAAPLARRKVFDAASGVLDDIARKV